MNSRPDEWKELENWRQKTIFRSDEAVVLKDDWRDGREPKSR